MKSRKSKKIESVAIYTNLDGKTTCISNTEPIEAPTIDSSYKRIEGVVPLGYGFIAPTLSKVGKDEKWGAKKGDIVMSFGWLPERLKTGSDINDEQHKYAEEHKAATLVITKEYALRMIQNLICMVNSN